MTDAGFYRGTNADQDGRFTDKEKKLLKQMKFEDALEKKIDMTKVNLDIIKPWITMRVAELLGIEDDVVTEYIFSQLEEKLLNPKVMQINITGFLNARRAREFMGELWKLLIEAEESEDGIPPTLVEKKLSEMRMSKEEKKDNIAVVVAESDWKHRYTTLSGGSYSGPMVKKEKDDRIYSDRGDRSPPRRQPPVRERESNGNGRDRERERERDGSRERQGRGDRERPKERDGTPPRRKEFDMKEKERQERKKKEEEADIERRRKENDREIERRRKERERRDEERKAEDRRRRERDERRGGVERRRKSRSRSSSGSSRSRSRSPPMKRRKFTEKEEKKKERSPSQSDSEEEEKRKKKKKKEKRVRTESEEEEKRLRKKLKKEKKRKEKERERNRSVSGSGSGSD